MAAAVAVLVGVSGGHARAPHRPPVLPATAAAVAWARATALGGMHEIGTTNCSPAIARWERHMGLTVPRRPPCRPWCGAFAHEAFRQAGIELSPRLIDPNRSYRDAVRHRRGLYAIPVGAVRPGDLLFFALENPMPAGHRASHVAVVIGSPHDGRVRTAEGNVGHHAVIRLRGLRYAVLAARVTRAPAA